MLFKVIATLSMFNTGIVRKNGYMDSQVDTIQERFQNKQVMQEQKKLQQEKLHMQQMLN